MELGRGQAPGKIILFGEHAVVYGRPALAVPVQEVQATATVETGAPGQGLTLWAADLGQEVSLRTASTGNPLASIARLTLAHLGMAEPSWRITIRSTIPIAGGLGSGAAVSAAIARGMAAAAGRVLPADALAGLVFETERLHHGTPSGIDNTVIAYGRPVCFVRSQPPMPFTVGAPFSLAIADSGIASPTRITVGDVRKSWQADPALYESFFDEIAEMVEMARRALADGQAEQLGPLMDANHIVLARMGVSSPALDGLVRAAREAGAGGAKLSGGGRGGNIIALVNAETAEHVAAALQAAGAARVITTTIAA